MSSTTAERLRLRIQGVVQGVGFRPFVHHLALRHGLCGYVLNDTRGVLVEVEGAAEELEAFTRELVEAPPESSSIDRVDVECHLSPSGYDGFHIVASQEASAPAVTVTPDLATCAACHAEFTDADQRRCGYPFTNCTHCGPRFTIITAAPYDRPNTTMRAFAMCDECSAEYDEPADRRFHAQPIACPRCGPSLRFVDNAGHTFVGSKALDVACEMLYEGRIVAIKGLGGFHLACNATNEAAVAMLRRRKHRVERPFALMARHLDMVRQYCEVGPIEASLLASRAAPIVVMPGRQHPLLSSQVAPGSRDLGFMLAYTPLHHLLMGRFDVPLVMTSGNLSDEPLACANDEALERLKGLADGFLLHDRDIAARCDDSVVRTFRGAAYPIRLSRGYAPVSLRVRSRFERNILACGAMLKNTFCLTQGDHVVLGPHIGDLENLETYQSYRDSIDHLSRLYRFEPELVAHDLHPEYLSTKYALSHFSRLPKVGVQHHHAHVAACMAENDLDGPVLGVAFDGLGYGTDGAWWGGEFLLAKLDDFERLAHMQYIPMPGGAAAIREPWRLAAGMLWNLLSPQAAEPYLRGARGPLLRRMLASGTQSPPTSSVGRLFDAVGAIVLGRDHVTYEGQAACELEAVVDRGCREAYSFDLTALAPLLEQLLGDRRDGVSVGRMAARFHHGLARAVEAQCVALSRAHGLQQVVLSGGCFQNLILTEALMSRLETAGLDVFVHRRVPTNDGGICLGQAVVANARLRGRT